MPSVAIMGKPSMATQKGPWPPVPSRPAIPDHGGGHGNGRARGAKNPRVTEGRQKQLTLATYNGRTLRLDEHLAQLEEELGKISLGISALEEVDYKLLEHDLSADTFESLNMTKEYQKFNLSEIEALNRRFDALRYYKNSSLQPNARRHYWSYQLVDRSCYLLAFTYQSAICAELPEIATWGCWGDALQQPRIEITVRCNLQRIGEIRSYYHRRFRYVNNLEYEIGYLVHEIVWKYQMMLEIYQLVYKRYFLYQNNFFTPVSYLLYLYSTELEYSMAVIHLCNMLHEVEKRYSKVRKHSMWEDSIPVFRSTRKRVTVNRTQTTTEIKENYFERKEQEQKRKAKARKQKKKEFEEKGEFILTTPPPTKRSGFWPLNYGWSIEYW